MKHTYDNLLPNTIEVGVYYIEDDKGFITHLDDEAIREEFEERLTEIKRLNKVKHRCEFNKSECIHKGTKVCDSCEQKDPTNYEED